MSTKHQVPVVLHVRGANGRRPGDQLTHQRVSMRSAPLLTIFLIVQANQRVGPHLVLHSMSALMGRRLGDQVGAPAMILCL